jgi:hypothetical protein
MKPAVSIPPPAMNCLASIVPHGLLRFLAFHSTVIFSALIIILVLAVFIWAAFLRKPSKHPVAHHHWKSKDGASDRKSTGSAPAQGARRRHKRRRPRKPLNPTLAETRGLPPVRDKQSTPPPAY